MLTENEATETIHKKAVGTGLAGARCCAGIAAGMQKFLQTFGLTPFVDLVGGDIRKENELAVLYPYRSFRPVEAIGELFDFCIRRDELIEGRIQSLDFAKGGILFTIQSGRRAIGSTFASGVRCFTGRKDESTKREDK